jgi:hypothetical protein
MNSCSLIESSGEQVSPAQRCTSTQHQCWAGGACPTYGLDPNKPACTEGISAVKAIAIAQSQGQKIFTINQLNASLAIPQLSHRASVIDEVWNAVNAGKEVVIHQSAITANGWSGAGYSVIDPETGAGGYLIEGGARGGFKELLDKAWSSLVRLIEWLQDANPYAVAATSLILLLFGAIGALLSLVVSGLSIVADIKSLFENADGSLCETGLSVLLGGLMLGLFAVGLAFGGFVGAAIALAFGDLLLSVLVSDKWVQSVCRRVTPP